MKPPPAQRNLISFTGLIEICGAGGGLATLTGFLGKLWWIFELTSHFRLHLAVALGSIAVIWSLKRRWRWAIVCSVLASIDALLVLALLQPSEQTAPPSGTHLRLVSVNVQTANSRTDLVLEFLLKTDADVVLLMEVDDRWMTALASLRIRYPEVIADPRDDNFGIALFSRMASTNGAVVHLGHSDVPSIITTLMIGGQNITLLGTHPLPPGSAEYARLRNEQLQEIAAEVRRCNLPAILLGDLNITPWSPYFKELLQKSDLRNTSQGRGLHGSWPAVLPTGRIPLDHCLVSPNIHMIDKKLGPQIGSDHLPIIIELQLQTR